MRHVFTLLTCTLVGCSSSSETSRPTTKNGPQATQHPLFRSPRNSAVPPQQIAQYTPTPPPATVRPAEPVPLPPTFPGAAPRPVLPYHVTNSSLPIPNAQPIWTCRSPYSNFTLNVSGHTNDIVTEAFEIQIDGQNPAPLSRDTAIRPEHTRQTSERQSRLCRFETIQDERVLLVLDVREATPSAPGQKVFATFTRYRNVPRDQSCTNMASLSDYDQRVALNCESSGPTNPLAHPQFSSGTAASAPLPRQDLSYGDNGLAVAFKLVGPLSGLSPHEGVVPILVRPDNQNRTIVAFAKDLSRGSYRSRSDRPFLIRLNSEGKIDSSFGEDGLLQIQIPSSMAIARGDLRILDLQPGPAAQDGYFALASSSATGKAILINFDDSGNLLRSYFPDGVLSVEDYSRSYSWDSGLSKTLPARIAFSDGTLYVMTNFLLSGTTGPGYGLVQRVSAGGTWDRAFSEAIGRHFSSEPMQDIHILPSRELVIASLESRGTDSRYDQSNTFKVRRVQLSQTPFSSVSNDGTAVIQARSTLFRAVLLQGVNNSVILHTFCETENCIRGHFMMSQGSRNNEIPRLNDVPTSTHARNTYRPAYNNWGVSISGSNGQGIAISCLYVGSVSQSFQPCLRWVPLPIGRDYAGPTEVRLSTAHLGYSAHPEFRPLQWIDRDGHLRQFMYVPHLRERDQAAYGSVRVLIPQEPVKPSRY